MQHSNGPLSIGDNIFTAESAWSFHGDVARNFDAHIQKSIPYYHEGHGLICNLSDLFLHNNSICYELGTATGTLIAKLASTRPDKNIRWIGIDAEKDMISAAHARLDHVPGVELMTADITTHVYEKSDLIISYYTAHFIPTEKRPALFQNLYKNLTDGGGFILFEKVLPASTALKRMIQAQYHRYKEEQGFTPEEISAKEKSLQGILQPISSEENIHILKEAGFTEITTIFKYLCFEGFLAIK